jgi:hypothetical protein
MLFPYRQFKGKKCKAQSKNGHHPESESPGLLAALRDFFTNPYISSLPVAFWTDFAATPSRHNSRIPLMGKRNLLWSIESPSLAKGVTV